MSVLPPTRQSCDRCRKQKLRCKRPDNSDMDFCERCLRKGAECTYSSSLPKGRPVTFRLDNGSPGPGYNTIEWVPMSCTGRGEAPEPQRMPCDTSSTGLLGDYVPVGISGGASPDFWTQFMLSEEDETTIAGIVSDIDMPFGPAPSPQQASPVTQGNHPEQPSQEYNTTKVVDHTDANCQQPQHWQQLHQGGAVHQAPPPFETAIRHGDTDNTSCAQNQGHLNQSILHLSQLSARLSSLVSSSRDYSSTTNNESALCSHPESALQQLQSNIGAAFESINVWLARGPAHLQAAQADQSNACPSSQSQLISHIFSASFEMTQIIQRLRVIMRPDMTPPPSPWPGQATTSTGNTLAETVPESSQQPYCTVGYLVVVCITLLLSTYIGIVISLQQSADALKAHQWVSSQTESCNPTDSAVCTWNEIDRIKLQFVGVVQMCSSFMRRQIEASERLMPDRLCSSELSGANSCWDAVGKLKLELEQRLRELQKCLDI
jgi:hypothetical protein